VTAYNLNGTANLITEGTLRFTAVGTTTGWVQVNDGNSYQSIIEAKGNFRVDNDYGATQPFGGGTAAITLNGTADQTVTETAGTWPTGAWTNSNTAGVILQATDVTLGGALETALDSKWCMEGYDLTASSITNDGIIYRHGAGDPSPPPAKPALDESHLPSAGGPALLSRAATTSVARQISSKRSIGRTGNILLRRRNRKLLG
jgi:hypothetical protein